MADNELSHSWIIAPADGPAIHIEPAAGSAAGAGSAQSTDLETLRAKGADPRIRCEPIGYCPVVTIHCGPIVITSCEILVRCGGAVTRDP